MPHVRSALTQPLVSHPGYGQGRPATPVAESGLPGGGPADKGLSLDKEIPGTATFNKPEGDIRQFDKGEPGSIYRKEKPDDVSKPQDDAGLDERDHTEFKPTFTGPGGRPKDDPTVTKRPYRDDHHHKHMAGEQAHFIVELFKLASAPEVTLQPELPLRVAVRIDEMFSGLNPKVVERGSQCSVEVKRVDKANLRWIFAVDCGNGVKVVKLKGKREGRIVKLTKMELKVKCSCNAFRWLGPEHHAQGEAYLDGKPRGTASVPVIKDPLMHNRICKHIFAVLSHVRGWEIPKTKGTAK